MHRGPVRHHVLVDAAAKQSIHAELVGLAEAHLRSQKIVTSRVIGVLLIRAVAVRQVRVADACGDGNSKELYHLLERRGAQFCSHGCNNGVEQILKPSERCIILKNLALSIENIPSVDLNRQHEAQTDKIKSNYSRRGGDVLIGGEVDNRVVYGHSKERGGIGIQRELGEQAKKVLGVELAPNEGPGDVYAAQDLKEYQHVSGSGSASGMSCAYIRVEQGRVDALGLFRVVWVHELRKKGILKIPQLLKGKIGRLRGIVVVVVVMVIAVVRRRRRWWWWRRRRGGRIVVWMVVRLPIRLPSSQLGAR